MQARIFYETDAGGETRLFDLVAPEGDRWDAVPYAGLDRVAYAPVGKSDLI